MAYVIDELESRRFTPVGKGASGPGRASTAPEAAVRPPVREITNGWRWSKNTGDEGAQQALFRQSPASSRAVGNPRRLRAGEWG